MSAENAESWECTHPACRVLDIQARWKACAPGFLFMLLVRNPRKRFNLRDYTLWVIDPRAEEVYK